MAQSPIKSGPLKMAFTGAYLALQPNLSKCGDNGKTTLVLFFKTDFGYWEGTPVLVPIQTLFGALQMGLLGQIQKILNGASVGATLQLSSTTDFG